jgi:hypothetical protein
MDWLALNSMSGKGALGRRRSQLLGQNLNIAWP